MSNKPCLLLLPGLDGSGELFGPLARHLEAHCELIVGSYPDLSDFDAYVEHVGCDWYGQYLTKELWGGSDGRIVRTETYTYEYNSTIRTYTRSIYHRGIYTIDGGIATTVVDNEMQVPLAATAGGLRPHTL